MVVQIITQRVKISKLSIVLNDSQYPLVALMINKIFKKSDLYTWIKLCCNNNGIS